MLLGTLAASVTENMLANKAKITGWGAIRTGQGTLITDKETVTAVMIFNATWLFLKHKNIQNESRWFNGVYLINN